MHTRQQIIFFTFKYWSWSVWVMCLWPSKFDIKLLTDWKKLTSSCCFYVLPLSEGLFPPLDQNRWRLVIGHMRPIAIVTMRIGRDLYLLHMVSGWTSERKRQKFANVEVVLWQNVDQNRWRLELVEGCFRPPAIVTLKIRSGAESTGRFHCSANRLISTDERNEWWLVVLRMGSS